MSADLIGRSTPIAPVPVAGTAFTAVVARFTDADGETDPTKYAALIRWGDGATSRGTVTADPAGGFDVVGSHVYSHGKAVRVTTQVGDADGDSVTITTTNLVSPAPLSAVGLPVRAGRNGIVSRATVAVFTSPERGLKASAFSAVIDWGDGTTSPGTIMSLRGGQQFRVIGSHRYASPGSYTVSATITQGPASAAASFTATNLVSDGAVAADHINPNFVNPWGLAAPNPGDFWSSNNGTGTSSVFDSAGNLSASLPVVTIPGPAGSTDPSAPTGIVFNGSRNFVVTDGTASGPAAFIFATEDGTIAGWNPRVALNGALAPSTHAVLAADMSASGAIFKGLTILAVPTGGPLAAGSYLAATDFHNGAVDLFDSSFHPVALPSGAFTDSSIPAGFAPFGVQSIDGKLYVTYAKQDDDREDDVAGPGNGFVDVYSTTGALIQRLGGSGIQTELNSPWAVVQAPSNFGAFSNAILVGNFGDSRVSAFDPNTGAFLGQLHDAQGAPLQLLGGATGIDPRGLWSLFSFPNGSGPNNTIYFTSGLNDEADGLFGAITPTQFATATVHSTATVRGFGRR
ncbi:TIGR03118 family protein [Paludisphaera rhizosphaerae]|uniref:TIGR03118 family protein n=1 Tax=Paludisphaera rhizosphaerae TaxID=2711216 RepID=UPI001981A337|nr:TIGR03118 family protein [Paludisphaera rhizosphaerae]